MKTIDGDKLYDDVLKKYAEKGGKLSAWDVIELIVSAEEIAVICTKVKVEPITVVTKYTFDRFAVAKYGEQFEENVIREHCKEVTRCLGDCTKVNTTEIPETGEMFARLETRLYKERGVEQFYHSAYEVVE